MNPNQLGTAGRVSEGAVTIRLHGTYVRYVHGPDAANRPGRGCRCEECRAANRAYERERLQRIAPPYVSAGEARAHVEMLAEHGIGLNTLARVAGVSHGCLSKLMHGDYKGRGPSKRIRKAAADKILAVQPGYHIGGGTRVDAAPVWKMVEEMVDAGIPKARIAERCGQSGPGLQLGRKRVTRRNALAVKELYDEFRAGTFVTVKRHRHGDRTIAPQRTKPAQRPIDPELIDALATAVEIRRDNADWRIAAACRGRPTYLWFPQRGDQQTFRAARRICDACVVRTQCLATHLREREGVFGGLAPKARRQLVRAS